MHWSQIMQHQCTLSAEMNRGKPLANMSCSFEFLVEASVKKKIADLLMQCTQGQGAGYLGAAVACDVSAPVHLVFE